MEGGKELVQEKALFTAGKLLGSAAAVMLFSFIFSIIINKFSFDKITFMVVLAWVGVVHLIIQGMVKRRWL